MFFKLFIVNDACIKYLCGNKFRIDVEFKATIFLNLKKKCDVNTSMHVL